MVKIFDRYITEITGLKMAIDIFDEHLPIKVKEDIKKYKTALLLDLYLKNVINGKKDEELEMLFKDYISITNLDVDNKSLTYSIDNSKKPADISLDIESARKTYEKILRTQRLTNNSFLITSLIIFETAILELLKKIISQYSKIYLNDEKIEVPKVINASSMESLKEEIINNKVSSIMRQNIFDWFKLLYDKQKIKINYKEDENIKVFLEGYYRRNIIVHNDCIANDEYLEKMSELGISSEVKVGSILDCSLPYVMKFLDSSIYTLINILTSCLKIFKDEDEGFIEEIQNYAVDLISAEKYELSTEIFKKMCEDDICDEQHKIYLKLNYWQSKKWNNQFEEIKNEVETLDISAKDDYIKLAKYALLDDFDKMIEIIQKMSINDKTSVKLYYVIEEWPIFKTFKGSKQYKEFLDEQNNILNANKVIDEDGDDGYIDSERLINDFEEKKS